MNMVCSVVPYAIVDEVVVSEIVCDVGLGLATELLHKSRSKSVLPTLSVPLCARNTEDFHPLSIFIHPHADANANTAEEGRSNGKTGPPFAAVV